MQRLVEGAERIGLIRAVRPLHDRGRASLTVLAYHRVMHAGSPDSYPFDLELISATPAEFEWQMQYIRENMNAVSLEQVLAHLEGGAPLPRNAVAVTFDDGFSDTYDCAFPIVRRLGIPCTVFVTTGYVESGEPFWFELAAYLMMKIPQGAIELAEWPQPLPYGSSAQERRRSLKRLLRVLKTLPDARRTALIHEWTARFAPQIDPDLAKLSRPVTWAEIAEMGRNGVGFGSHTVSHPNLRQLAEADLSRELSESKRALERQLGAEVALLAYPIGTPAAYDQRVIEAARATGFRLAVSYTPGANWQNALDRFEIRRHGIGLGTTRSYFRALTAVPAWVP